MTEAVQVAQELLAGWAQRLAMLPSAKPLSANWMPALDPDGQVDGVWWSWSPGEPELLRHAGDGRALPDEFPFRNHAAFCAYRFALRDRRLLQLGEAYRLTHDARYAAALADLLARYGELYPTYPISLEEDAGSRTLPLYDSSLQGTRYTVRVGHGWADTEDLQFWLRAYRLVRDCREIGSERDAAIRRLAREILEFETFPNWLYVNDKLHNSLTNVYEACILAGTLWGESLEVCDRLAGMRYSGADLVQLALHGPKGLLNFIANAFDRNGVYWELSASYTDYCFTYIYRTLDLLRGYSDPTGYRPRESIVSFFQPIKGFSPHSVPQLWRAVLAQTRLAMNDGLYPPTNDTNPIIGTGARWLGDWAELLSSSEIADAATRLEETSCAVHESVLFPASGTVTMRSPGGRLDVHLDWHAVQDYHSHRDPLNLVLAAEGYRVLSDLGYHSGHPLRHVVSERTAAHNTVSVDGQDSRNHGRGRLHAFVSEGPVQLVDSSVPDAYPQCDLYRRTVVLIEDAYCLDFFRVRGGSRHDYVLVSRAAATATELPLIPNGKVLADLDRYDTAPQLDTSFETPSPAAEAILDPRVLRLGATAGGSEASRVDWPQRERPDLTTRVHLLPVQGPGASKIITARVPFQDRRANRETRTDEMLIVRREGAPDLTSTFASAIEVVSPKSSPLESVRRLPLESPDSGAVAVAIVQDRRVDLVLHATTPGPHRLHAQRIAGRALDEVTLNGTFAVIRLSLDETLDEAVLASGTLEGVFGRIEAPHAQGAQVVAIDFENGIITLDRPLATARDLAGKFVERRSRSLPAANGGLDHWRIERVEDEFQLRLDRKHSGLIEIQGRVEQVENERTFWTSVNFCTEPAPGTPIRIGPVGDYSVPAYHLEYARQTGLPQRVGGTTTNHGPRRYALGLDKSARLTSTHVGLPFWSSGIEIGDYLFTRPSVHVKVRLA